MNTVIRKANLDDLSKIQQLGTELMVSDRRFDPLMVEQWYFSNEGTKYLLSRIKGRNRTCLVATIKNEVIGYATVNLLTTKTWRPIRVTELENLIVAKKYRKHGAGNMLITAFKDWSKSKGAARARLDTLALNKDAIAFYEKTGFIAHHQVMEAEL